MKSPDPSTPHSPAPPSSGPESCSSVFSAYFCIFNVSFSAGLLPNYCILDHISSSSQIKTIRAPHTKCPWAPCIPPTTAAMAFPFSHTQTLNKRARTHCLPLLTSHSHSSPHPVPAFPGQIQTSSPMTTTAKSQIDSSTMWLNFPPSTKHFDHSIYSSWDNLLLGLVLRASWFSSQLSDQPPSQASFSLFMLWRLMCLESLCLTPFLLSSLFQAEVLNLESTTSWCPWFWSHKPYRDFWVCYFSGEKAKAFSRFPKRAVTSIWWNFIVLGHFTFCPGFVNSPQAEDFWVFVSSFYVFLKKDVSQPRCFTVISNSIGPKPNSLSSPETWIIFLSYQSFQATKIISFSPSMFNRGLSPLILLFLHYSWAYTLLPSPHYYLGLSQELTNFFYKGPNSKGSKLCGLV